MTAVVWVNPDPHWDEQIIRELTAGDEWTHHRHFNPVVSEGAVVVIPGQHHVNDVDRLAAWLRILPWALTIITSDEEALFPVESLPRDERHVVWGQYHARPEFDRVIPLGCPPGTGEALAAIGTVARMGDVFFAGQDTHERRHELIATMKEMAPDWERYGNLTWAATTGFCQGLSRDRYLRAMRDTRIAPCPSGPHSLDSFRLYEALAAGCLPVIELCTPHGDERAFWDALFGPDNPIPQVWSWHELIDLAPYWKQGIVWGERRDEVQAWWEGYREDLEIDFANTISRLRQS